jgi:hypothetical protein
MRRLSVLVLLALCGVFAQMASGQIPAFSGAEGPGANASGGRGGDVYHVTNLQFDKDGLIPGSLKYGINNAPIEGRTIVFDVGGTIYQNGGGSNWWFRASKSNITIAGQTAPGGITLAGVGSKFTGDNLVVRNLTIRPNQDPANPNNFTYDGLATQATNSIFDHISVTWYTDEGISATDAVNNTTVQYSLIGEGLNYNGHSYGSILNTQNNNAPMAYHHNVYAHNASRMPRLGSETGTGAIANFYNNVIYNWTSRAGYSALNADSGAQEPSRTNFINNFYARGASNGSTIFLSAGDQTQIYHSGNLYDGVRDADFNDAVAVTWSHFTGTETQLASPLAVAAGVIDATTVGRDRALSYSGANWWNRHAIDQRIISSVSAGTGTIINTVSTTEWNDVLNAPMQTRAVNWDTDTDGMPDEWEEMHGLNPTVADNNGDFDGDTYTNLEEYLNGIAEWPAPQAITFIAATNSRYAQITNWDIEWQPSRFDEARINSGTVAVDAVGQHAGNLKVAYGAADTATLNITAGWLDVANTLTIGSTATSQGTVNLSGGILRANRVEKGAAGQFVMTGGVLAADEVAFSFTNNGGVISPGSSPGVTHVIGDLTMNSGSIYLEIAGNTEALYDQLQVDGTLTAGGILDVALVGYSPVVGDSFDLLDFGSITGGFTVSLPSLNTGLAWDVSAFETTGTLSVIADIVEDADFDGDGDVDGRDFLIWQRGFGLTEQENNSLGDANGDGDVNEGDLAIWQTQYAEPGELNATQTAVPEPGTLVIVGVMVSMCIYRRIPVR